MLPRTLISPKPEDVWAASAAGPVAIPATKTSNIKSPSFLRTRLRSATPLSPPRGARVSYQPPRYLVAYGLPDPIIISHGRASGTSPYSTTNATTSTATSIASPRARLVARSRRSDAKSRRGAGLGTVWASATSATCPALGPSAASSRTRGLRRMGSRRCLRVDRRLPATPSSFRVHDRRFRRPITAIVQARRPRRRPQTRPGGPPRRLAAHKP